MLLRPYQVSDVDRLIAIYRDAVIHIGSSAYDAQQVAVWSSYPESVDDFRSTLSQGLTVVALEDDYPVAFGQLHPLDHIAFLYTDSSVARRGYATAIYQQIETHAIANGIQRLHTEASHISKHFFLKMGFSVVELEVVDRQGVMFERFKMERLLPNYSEYHKTMPGMRD